MMHLAAQYLAAAGISFLPKKEDDSHTNLGFDTKNGRLITRPLDKPGHVLALNYQAFSLEWLDREGVLEEFPLDGKTHANVLGWLQNSSKMVSEEDAYRYEFHYQLPYTITDSFKFQLEDKAVLFQLLELRILAQNSIQSFLEVLGLESEVRIWPHHFDTGAFALLNESDGMALGLGLAIPDTLCEVHYFYMSAYRGHEAISPEGLKPLRLGKWVSRDFKGAILPADSLELAAVEEFFKEAYFSLSSL